MENKCIEYVLEKRRQDNDRSVAMHNYSKAENHLEK